VPVSVEVREATDADAAAIARLTVELGYAAEPGEVARRLADLPAGHHVFVAVDPAGAPVGWVHVNRSVSIQSGPRAEIGGLVVAAGWRGRGVGSALMDRAEAWAREHGLAAVVLRSNVRRAGAHEFYQGRGYDRVKTSVVFRRDLGG
jgi:GNAT superfamily N-acetyltransferase